MSSLTGRRLQYGLDSRDRALATGPSRTLQSNFARWRSFVKRTGAGAEMSHQSDGFHDFRIRSGTGEQEARWHQGLPSLSLSRSLTASVVRHEYSNCGQILIFTEQSTKWLQLLLRERYGGDLTLSEKEDTLVLRCPQFSGSVTFDRLDPRFQTPTSNLPCTMWDAHAEGWVSPLKKPLPVPGVLDITGPLIERVEDNHLVHYDILGFSYWMLTRLEEIDRSDLDHHCRFPATSSHAYRNGYLERPVVDEWLDLLAQVMQRQWPNMVLKQNRFRTLVSHDVDHPSRYGFRTVTQLFRAMGGDIVRRRDFKGFFLAPWIHRSTKTRLHPADPWNTFEWIMDISEKHGIRSAFYFICGRTNPAYDAFYEPDDPAIVELMLRIHNRGHEIGLHPSYDAYLNADTLSSEASRLRTICEANGIVQSDWGGRMHYLRWKQPTTMLAWESAGMSYDSSLGYADRSGFRCGTCFEYQAFDPIDDRVLDLRIRPLLVMEGTVIAPDTMNRDSREIAYRKIMELKNSCRSVKGNFTLLWHNSECASHIAQNMYEEILQN